MLLVNFSLLADVPTPTRISIYLKKDGAEFHQQAALKIACFGWMGLPGKSRPEPYTPKELYSLDIECADYGCQKTTNTHFNYAHFDYCNLSAKTDSGVLESLKYAQSPFSNCSWAGAGDFEQKCDLHAELKSKS